MSHSYRQSLGDFVNYDRSSGVLTLDSDTWTMPTPGATLQSDAIAIYRYAPTAGSNGGQSTGNVTWATYPLATEVYDPRSIGTIASNQITLAAGTYLAEGWATFFFGAGVYCKIRLFNVTAGAVISGAVSGTEYSTNCTVTPRVTLGFVLAVASAIRMDYRTSATASGVDLGAGFSTDGYAEVFGELKITKLA